MVRRGVVALLALTVGCGDEDGDCPPLDGTYRQTMREVSGDCLTGDIEQLVSFSAGEEGGIPAECTGRRDLSPDMCSVDSDILCDVFDQVTGEQLGGTSRLVGTLDQDGDRITGTVQVTLTNPAFGSCTSIYEVIATKI